MNPQDNTPITPVGPTPPPSQPTPPLPPPELPPLPNEGQFTDASVQQIIGFLGQATEQVTPFAQVVDGADKKRMAKPRPGIEQQVPLVVSLAQRYGVNPVDYTLDDFQADVDFATRMGEIQIPVVVLSQLVTDTVFVTRSRYYAALTSIYSALQALAGHNPQLLLEIEPLTKFFAHAPKKPKKPEPVSGGTTGTSAPASPPPATNAGTASAGASSPAEAAAIRPLSEKALRHERRRVARSA